MKMMILSVFVLFSQSGLAETAKSELSIALVQEWNQFNPITASLASTQALAHFVSRQMVNRDAKGVVIPEVAIALPTKANKKLRFVTNGKRRQVVADWEIQKTAVWADGTPLTCADWKLGWEVGMSPNVSTSDKSSYDKIEKIEWDTKNPKLCTATYKTDEWTYDRDLPPFLPAHLEAAVFAKWKDQKEAYDQNTVFVKDPTNPGLYNGPYLVKEFKLGSHIIFEPNPKFDGQKPQIQRIIVKHFGDTKTLRSNLETHQIDAVSSVGFPPDLALNLATEAAKTNANYKVIFRDSPIFQGLFFNVEDPILKDIKVREAVAMAIDKEELTKAFFQGKLQPANTFIPLTNPSFVQRPAEFSLNDSRKRLEAAGWKLGADGVRIKDGNRLSLSYRTSAGILVLETIQTYVCSQLQKVGAECLIRNQPPRVLLGETVARGDFSMVMFGWPVAADSSLRGQFSSKEIPTKDNAWTGQNSLRWRSAKVDQIVEKFDKEWDFKKRVELVRQLDLQIMKEKPMVPLYHRREAVVLPKNLEGFENDFSGTSFSFPERWRLIK